MQICTRSPFEPSGEKRSECLVWLNRRLERFAVLVAPATKAAFPMGADTTSVLPVAIGDLPDLARSEVHSLVGFGVVPTSLTGRTKGRPDGAGAATDWLIGLCTSQSSSACTNGRRPVRTRNHGVSGQRIERRLAELLPCRSRMPCSRACVAASV